MQIRLYKSYDSNVGMHAEDFGPHTHTHVERHDASKICTLACVRISSLVPFFHTLKFVNFFENRAWHDLHLTQFGDLSADFQANLKFNQLKLPPNCVK